MIIKMLNDRIFVSHAASFLSFFSRIILGLFLCSFAHAGIHVIELQQRTADSLVEVVESMLPDGAKVQVYGNQLIISSDEKTFLQIKNLVEKLDTPPKKLLIHVRQVQQTTIDRSKISASGEIQTGDIDVSIDSEPSMHSQHHHEDVDISLKNQHQQRQDDGVQTVQAVEGYPATIQIGQIVPYRETVEYPYGHSVEQTTLQPVTRGFDVVVRVIGNDRVDIRVAAHNDRLARYKQIDTQSVETQVQGKLNEWINVGGVTETSQHNQQSWFDRSTSQKNMATNIEVKVEVMP